MQKDDSDCSLQLERRSLSPLAVRAGVISRCVLKMLVRDAVAAALIILSLYVIGSLLPKSDVTSQLSTESQDWTRSVGGRNVLVRGRIRSAPGSDFRNSSVKAEMLPFTLWTSLEGPPCWRAEKPGFVCEGTDFVQYRIIGSADRPMCIADDLGYGLDTLGWIGPFVWLDHIFIVEEMFARTRPTEVKTSVWKDASGSEKRTITIVDQCGVRPGIESLERTYFRTGNTREYTMDESSHRLEKISVYANSGSEKILVFETESIEFDTLPTTREGILENAEMLQAMGQPAKSYVAAL